MVANKEMISERFRNYIRSELSCLNVSSYKSILVPIRCVYGRPSFDACLDGTYFESEEHENSLLCFCSNDSCSVCFVQDNKIHTTITSNPPDDMHETNWNREKNVNEKTEYSYFFFDRNIFLEEGKYESRHENRNAIIIDHGQDAIVIEYRSCLGRFIGYIDKSMYRLD